MGNNHQSRITGEDITILLPAASYLRTGELVRIGYCRAHLSIRFEKSDLEASYGWEFEGEHGLVTHSGEFWSGDSDTITLDTLFAAQKAPSGVLSKDMVPYLNKPDVLFRALEEGNMFLAGAKEYRWPTPDYGCKYGSLVGFTGELYQMRPFPG